jgi:hypothetical protein
LPVNIFLDQIKGDHTSSKGFLDSANFCIFDMMLKKFAEIKHLIGRRLLREKQILIARVY